MALTILNNIAALAAENQLNITSSNLNSTLEELSSGSRINSGADDPAGLAIANGLEANVAALTQSASNATDGVGELQVADGSLSQVTTLLDRAVTLATEAATGTVSDSQRTAIDTEYQSIKAEIDSIGSTTNYNGGQVFTNNTLNVFLSDGSTSGSSNIGVSTGILSSTSLGLGGTPATAVLSQSAVPAVAAQATLTGGAFVGSTEATATLTGGVFSGTAGATDTLTGGAFTGVTAATNTLTATDIAAVVAATDTLTGSASWVGATAATGTLTISAGTISDGDTVTLGGQTYTFKTTLDNGGGAGSANEVLIGGSNTNALANLQAAINGAAGAGTDYGAPTVTNANLTASGAGASSVNLTAKVDGVAGNTGAITYTGTATGGGTIGGAVAGDTVSVGGQTYTFVSTLSTTPTAGEVVVGTGGSAEATSLTNLEAAVNNSGGSNYSANTPVNANVIAGASSGTTITFSAKTPAAGNNYGDSLTASTTGHGVFSSANFIGGAAPTTATIGSTTYTFVSALTGAANEVLVGLSQTATLANLAGAVNASSSGGQAAGTTYGFGTVANTAASAGTAANSALTFTAKNPNSGDSYGNGVVSTISGGAGTFGTASFAGGAAGDSVTIAGQTYNFVAALSGAANEVLVGANEAASLANLVGAVTGASTGGQGAGTTYGNGTIVNANVTGVANGGGTTATFTAKNPSAGNSYGNNLSTAITGGVGAFSSTNFTGGALGNQVTIGSTTYTFVDQLSGAANEVLVGTGAGAEATSLANLVGAVNAATTGGQAAGTTYGAGTVANAAATGIAGSTTAVFTATHNGTAIGDSVVSTITGGGSFGGATFSGATNGDTITVGNTTYQFVHSLSPSATANEVLVGADEQHSLANLVAAVNGAGGAGTVYGTGTVANTTATGVAAPTTATFTAVTPGVAGNSLATGDTGGVGNITAFTGGAAAVAGGGPATAGDTVTVGTQTYSFVSSLSENPTVPNQVLVGANEAASLANLADAVNGTTGAGSAYSLGTVANTSATAVASSTAVTFTALTGGSAGDQIASTTTGGDNQFTATTFTGGGTQTNDLLSSSDAQSALTLINDAVAQVAALRGNLGATVNRLQAASNVITNQTQNLTSAENDVTAADIPSTVANLSQYSILEQTGVSALAQANQQQQLVLKLLQ